MNSIKVIIPLPSYGFDPTEVAIPWKLLTQHKIQVQFATPNGKKAAADRRMLHGTGLRIWKKLLMARKDAVLAYMEMERSYFFNNPLTYSDINPELFDGILLPGGHVKAVKAYLESTLLQHCVLRFFENNKIVAAICHGVVLVARSINPVTNQSVLYHYKTTALLQSQEKMAYRLTRLWLKKYYLTYPHCTVEEEVKAALGSSTNFLKGPFPFLRDSVAKPKRGFVVKDRNYLSARWPGDAYLFAQTFIEMLEAAKVVNMFDRAS
jgi:protease I